MPDPRIPDKQYFKIGEVAKIVGVKPSVLRFWETEFRTLKPEKSRTNQRLYARRHVEKLLEIKELLYDRKYTIAGARKRLKDREEPAAAEVPSGADRGVLREIEKHVRELLQLCDE